MTNIKERILQFVESQGFNKEEFFHDLGLSYSNFKGIQKKSALNSDAIVRILSKHQNLSLEWLILGKGEMISTKNLEKVNEAFSITVSEPSENYQNEPNLINALNDTITILKNDVDNERNNVEFLKKIIESKLFT